MGIDAFDTDLRRQYIVDIARGLSVDPSAVSITSVRESVARRVHKPQIVVETSVVVSPDTILAVKQDLARNELTMTIQGVLVSLAIIEKPAITDAIDATSVTTTPPHESRVTAFAAEGQLIQIIIYVATAVGLAIGILLITWRLCTRHGLAQDGTREPDIEADAFNVVPAAGASYFASPIESPGDDVEVSTDTRWA